MDYAFKTIKKNTAVDMVVEQILKQIEDQTLPPGSRLPAQRELAVMLGVGRSSIREAINSLVVKGYLEPIQGKGTFIKNSLPSADTDNRLKELSTAVQVSSIFDLMEARMVLECKTASLVAERVSPGSLQKIQEIFDTLSRDTDHERYAVFLASDLEFHYALAEATRNKIICAMTKFVLLLLGEHHQRLKTDQLSHAYREKSVKSLEKVLNAIKEQDPSEAALWMERHLLLIKEELDKVL